MSTIRKSFMTTAMLSLFLGFLGVDRFYLGKVGTGILKLLTFGGFAVWYLIDLILILTGSMRDANGHELEGRNQNIRTALIITGVVFLVSIIFNAANASNISTTLNKTTDTTISPQEQENKSEATKTEQEDAPTTQSTQETPTIQQTPAPETQQQSPAPQQPAPQVTTNNYESIYNTYAARLRAECPTLSMMECAEVSNEGILKMAEYMYTAKGTEGQYATYEQWAGKLQEVYLAEAR